MTVFVFSIRFRRREIPRPDRRVPGRDRRRHDGVRRSAFVHSAARRSFPRRRLLPGIRGSRRAAEAPQAAKVSTTGCPRCTTAVCSDACSRNSRRSRGAWCATSTMHRRRAHAAHDPQPGTHLVDRGPVSIPFPQHPQRARSIGAAGAGAAAPRRRQVARRRPRPRVSGWPWRPSNAWTSSEARDTSCS